MPFNTSSQYLELFGIPKNRILSDKNYWYFAKNLYIRYPMEHIFGYMSVTFPKVIKILREKTGVNNIKAYRYIFSNRPMNTSRHVDNLEEFYEATKIQYPEYSWEIDNNKINY